MVRVVAKRNYYRNLSFKCLTDAISDFNDDIGLLASDFLMDKHFIIMEQGLVPLKVILLDRVWSTQLFRNEGASERIWENLMENWKSICSYLENLKNIGIKDSPKEVYAIARDVFSYILNIKGIKQHYSFTTKFFHWCTREHFPIVDNRARIAINKIQRNHNITRGIVLKSTAEMGRLSYLDEYERWIYFYSDLLNSMAEANYKELIAIDKQTQNSTSKIFTVENSLLRILDKVFYILGKT